MCPKRPKNAENAQKAQKMRSAFHLCDTYTYKIYTNICIYTTFVYKVHKCIGNGVFGAEFVPKNAAWLWDLGLREDHLKCFNRKSLPYT